MDCKWCWWVSGTLVVFVALVYFPIVNHQFETKCKLDDIKMDGKVVIVTGANAGIGYHTTLELVRRGATVVMGCRSLKKGQASRKEIVKVVGGRKRIVVEELDLSLMKSVVKFVEKMTAKYTKIHVMVNNAAVGLGEGSKGRGETEEGLERIMATNHLGHFLLTNKILPSLSPDGIIISVSSDSNQRDSGHDLHSGDMDPNNLNSDLCYDKETIYGDTKLANIMMIRELSYILPSSQPGINVFSVDPGFTHTSIHSSQLPWWAGMIVKWAGPLLGAWPPSLACGTVVWLASGGAGQGHSGAHWHDCTISDKVDPRAGDRERVQNIWLKSKELVEEGLLSSMYLLTEYLNKNE